MRSPFVFTTFLAITVAAAGLFRPAAAAFPDSATRPATMPTTSPAAVRVVTFNIRNSGARDGPDAWPLRKDVFVSMVRKLNPDVLGLQEVLADQQDDLVKALPDYDTFFVGRDDGQRKGEASPIFFRRDRFTLVDHGSFWLAETPDVVGAVGWDAALTRICTWAVLRPKRIGPVADIDEADRDAALANLDARAPALGGSDLVVANTHFDHIGVKARVESAKLIVARVNALAAGRPAVLIGDLNSTDESPTYAEFLKTQTPPKTGGLLFDPPPTALPWVDAYRVVHPQHVPDEATFHAFKGGTRALRIDYIFNSPSLTPTAAGIDRDRGKNGRFPSDHYPVWADLTMPPARPN